LGTLGLKLSVIFASLSRAGSGPLDPPFITAYKTAWSGLYHPGCCFNIPNDSKRVRYSSL